VNPGFRVGRCDLTYFLLHQSDVIRKAIDSLHDYIARKTRGTRENQGLLRDMRQLNLRQQALAGHASRHPGTVHTIGGHQRSHDTAYNTAQTDLLSLAEKGLFLKAESGKRKAERIWYSTRMPIRRRPFERVPPENRNHRCLLS